MVFEMKILQHGPIVENGEYRTKTTNEEVFIGYIKRRIL